MFYLHKFEWAGKNLTIRQGKIFSCFYVCCCQTVPGRIKTVQKEVRTMDEMVKEMTGGQFFFTFFSMRRLGKCHRSYLLQGTYWYFYFAWYYWNWRWKKYMIEIIDFQFLPHDQVNVEPTPQIKSSVSTFSFWVTDTADYIINKGLPSHPLSSSISR